MTSSKLWKGVNPNPPITMAMKVEMGPLAIMINTAMAKESQKRGSTRTSSACLYLKCVLRTPALLTRNLETAMYRSLSDKFFAWIGSGGMKKSMMNAQTTVKQPATRYMYCQGLSGPLEIWPTPQLTNGLTMEMNPSSKDQYGFIGRVEGKRRVGTTHSR